MLSDYLVRSFVDAVDLYIKAFPRTIPLSDDGKIPEAIKYSTTVREK